MNYLDCNSCQLPSAAKSSWGCRWMLEPSSDWVPQPPGAYIEATACPGYSEQLNEVREVVSVHKHWTKGSLEHRVAPHEPTQPLMSYLESLDNAINSAESYAIRSKQEDA